MIIEENISTVKNNTYKHSTETVSKDFDSKNDIMQVNINRKNSETII